jgi:hypothetical protein
MSEVGTAAAEQQVAAIDGMNQELAAAQDERDAARADVRASGDNDNTHQQQRHTAVASADAGAVVYGPHPPCRISHPCISAYADIVLETHDFSPLADVHVDGMNCAAMRKLLARRGLRMTGNKAALRNRLLAAEPDVATVEDDVRRKVLSRVLMHIREYGEDGMGDKPAHMDTVEYWLSHFEPESFV